MTVTEKIFQHVKTLPESAQSEVLDFVVFLESKNLKHPAKEDETNWSNFSLSQAMHGMESEPPLYSPEDLKEVF